MPIFSITIPDDQTDCLDALAYERDRVIATGQAKYTIEDVIADAIVTKFTSERASQIAVLKEAAAMKDPVIADYYAKQEAKQADALAKAEAAQTLQQANQESLLK